MLRSARRAKLFALNITRRCAGSRSLLTDAASHPTNLTQVYVSHSRDPFLNLSIEHHLLQTTHPESTVLFLYTNSPCVVIGRNQNPWLEVNLARLAQIRDHPQLTGRAQDPVQLVRRRSGGGTVFHDEGNVNFSVMCPPSAFDRDTHGEMVVRALKSLGRDTRVNERHDIVMDVPSRGQTFKVSGSAYKLTRLRALHHGTCLLRSPNLVGISSMLRSPAEPFIKARGVDSVRSPVANVNVSHHSFQHAVLAEFGKMYGDFDVEEEVGEEDLGHGRVADGLSELQSPSWIYGQTPRFVFSTHPSEADPRPRPDMKFPFNLNFEARHGVIEQFGLTEAAPPQQSSRPSRSRSTLDNSPALNVSSFIGTALQDISDWGAPLAKAGLSDEDARSVGKWMNEVLGTEFIRQQR